MKDKRSAILVAAAVLAAGLIWTQRRRPRNIDPFDARDLSGSWTTSSPEGAAGSAPAASPPAGVGSAPTAGAATPAPSAPSRDRALKDEVAASAGEADGEGESAAPAAARSAAPALGGGSSWQMPSYGGGGYSGSAGASPAAATPAPAAASPKPAPGAASSASPAPVTVATGGDRLDPSDADGAPAAANAPSLAAGPNPDSGATGTAAPAPDPNAAAAATVSADPGAASGGGSPSTDGSSGAASDPGTAASTDASSATADDSGSAPAADAPPAAPADAAADDGSDDSDPPTPVVGAPQLPAGQAPPHSFRPNREAAATVQTYEIAIGGVSAVKYQSDLIVDRRGSSTQIVDGKPVPTVTALRYPDGSSLNPKKIPYIVIPRSFQTVYPKTKLGDYAAVTYGDRTLYAIVGDFSTTENVLGGGSITVARGLDIDTTKHGDAADGVSYVIVEGSAGATVPKDGAAVEAAGAKLFAKDGIPVQ